MDWLERFRASGAVWEAGAHGGAPHVKTSLQGKHLDKYFNSDRVLSRPRLVGDVVRSVLVPKLDELGWSPTWVVSYAPFGLFLAYASADILNASCGYVVPEEGYSTGFAIEPSDSVLVVADDIYSGTSIAATVDAIAQRGARVLPFVFALANLSGEANLGEQSIVAAATLPAQRYEETECPLCERGSPALLPRPNWELFSIRV
jgi:orotate phosphoribosyltransferase